MRKLASQYMLVKESKILDPIISPARKAGEMYGSVNDSVLEVVGDPISRAPYLAGGAILGAALGGYAGRKLFKHVSKSLTPPPLAPKGFTPKQLKGWKKLNPKAHWNAMLDNVQGRITHEIVPSAARDFAQTSDKVTRKALESGYVGLGGLLGGAAGYGLGSNVADRVYKKRKSNRRRRP
jgi:hypothetical protein